METLTAAVDFAPVGVAILAIAALKVVPLVTIWGTKTVLSMIRR